MRSLSFNNLTDGGKDLSGVLKLAEALKTNTTLTKVRLDKNQLGPEGAAKLAEVFNTNRTLKRLECAAAPACSLVRPRPLPRAACAPVHLACRRVCCSLGGNGIPEEAKEAVREAAGPGVELPFLNTQ